MKIHLLTDSYLNPVLTTVMTELSQQHDVAVFDAKTLPAGYGRGQGLEEPADVVLLKARSPQARQVAQTAQDAGSRVVNSPAATALALDRAASADALARAAVPAPRHWHVAAMRHLAYGPELPWPLVVKSRASSRRDLVRLVAGRAELLQMLPEWGDEPVVAQEFVVNDGFDIKVWVIGDDMSAARRRSALESIDKSSDELLDPAGMPEEWTRTARDAGAALGLQLFGVDLLVTDGRPLVVDVNPFPGFRGARHPAESLLRFLSTTTTTTTTPTTTGRTVPA